MKSIIKFLGIILIGLTSACDEQIVPPSESSDEAPSTQEAAKTLTYYGLRPTDNSWPQVTAPETLSSRLGAANYYIVLDGSGSMTESDCAPGSDKMTVAKQALNEFAKQIPQDANLGLFVFDAFGVNERVSLGTNNRSQFFAQVNSIFPGDGTPLASAIGFAYQSLIRQAAKQLGYGEYHLVVVTDGIAFGREVPTDVVDMILLNSPVIIHSIGFCIDENHSLNQPGKTAYMSANSAEELRAGLQSVLAEAPDFSPDSFQ